ncbi:MAG: outer membrane protein assembly factor BamE [Pseudomonadota bacterium]
MKIQIAQIARRALLVALLVAGAAGSGCVYRLNIQQGNIAEAGDVDQVKVGMTPSQVRFLLGSPMVDDPFHTDRWDYVYYQRIGRRSPTTQAFLTVYFEDGVVSRLEQRDEAPLKRSSREPQEEDAE